jgi:hypothetical protein
MSKKKEGNSMKLFKQSLFWIVLLGFLSVAAYGQNTIYIDPTNTADPEQDGSEAHPYDHWEGLNFQDNTTYLLKRGTVLQEDLITEISNLENTTFGAYGTGDLPRIETKVVRVTSCSNLVFNDLDILSDGKHVMEFRNEGKSYDVEINNCKIHSPPTWETGDYNFGISAGVDGLKITDSEIYNIYLDGLYFDHANNIVIEDSYIHDINQAYHDDPDGAPGDGIQFNDTDSIFIRNTVIDRTNSGKKFCIIVINPSDDVNVETVVMEDNTFIGPGIHDHGGAGVFFGVPTVTFRRNVVKDAPVGVYSHASDIVLNNNHFINNTTGINVAGNTAEIYNNVFYGNSTAVDFWGNPSSIKNNIVYLTDGSQIGFYGSSDDMSHNLQNVSSSANSSFDAGIIANPQFVSPDDQNFHLQVGSPAIDDGTDVGITYDFDGNLIPCNGIPDIGAFEYQGNCSGGTNHSPVADAGSNIVIDEGEQAVLDGSGSYDPDGDSLSFMWDTPAIINLSDPNAEQPVLNAPEVNSDTTLNVILEVSDAELTSEPDGVSVTINNLGTGNSRPVAVTGPDQEVAENEQVQLDGSDSYDPDQDSLLFTWDAPGFITLSDPNAEMPTFMAPSTEADTTFFIVLTVSDGDLVSNPDSVYITITNQTGNSRPVAEAGYHEVLYETQTGSLDGSYSYDPDGDNIEYMWQAPGFITLSDTSAVQPSFEAPSVDEDTVLTVYLRVSDGELISEPDSVYVKIKNQDQNSSPVADAGEDQSRDEMNNVILDGSESYDPDGDSIEFMWDEPNDISLSEPGTAQPSFTAPEVDEDTTLLVVLRVSDGDLISEPDSVYITILNKDDNSRPIAEAGYHEVLYETQTGILDGSNSYDPDDESLNYYWDAPDFITLSDPNAAQPTFEAPVVSEDTVLTVYLRVGDGDLLSDPDSVYVKIKDKDQNSRPVAVAGEDQEVDGSQKVYLDGSESYDPDGDAIEFVWNAPEEIDLSDATAISPHFYAPEFDSDTTLYIDLKVSDGDLVSKKDSVKIKIYALATSINDGDFNEKESFVLFPNPTYGELKVRYASDIDLKDLRISIYSIEGKQMSEKFVGGRIAEGQILRLNANKLPNGMYILSIQHQGEILYSKQFIKR